LDGGCKPNRLMARKINPRNPITRFVKIAMALLFLP
jgi:hypothetical protein